jgi:hypothetical protein
MVAGALVHTGGLGLGDALKLAFLAEVCLELGEHPKHLAIDLVSSVSSYRGFRPRGLFAALEFL